MRIEKRIVYKINEENRKEHVRKNINKFDSDLKSLQQNIPHTDTVYSKRKRNIEKVGTNTPFLFTKKKKIKAMKHIL